MPLKFQGKNCFQPRVTHTSKLQNQVRGQKTILLDIQVFKDKVIPCTLSQYCTGVRSYNKIVEKDEMIFPDINQEKIEAETQESCNGNFNNGERRFQMISVQ